MGLSFCLKGMVSFSKGILCWMMMVSYVFGSLYSHAKTSANSFIKLQNLDFYLAVSLVDIFISFGWLWLPMFCSWIAGSSSFLEALRGISM